MNYLEKRKGCIDEELKALKSRLEELEKINDDENADEEVLQKASAELDELMAKKAELEGELAEVNAEIEALTKQDEPKVVDEPKEPMVDEPKRKLPFIKMEERKEEKKMNIEERTKQAEAFARDGKMSIDNKELRATLVSSGTIATPTSVKGINELDNVASIVDKVMVEECYGMGSNKIAYEVSAPIGGATTEGDVYKEGDTTFGFKTITPTKLTTFATISEEARQLSPLAYEDKVKRNAMVALRRAVSKYIVDKVVASDLKVAMELTAIDQKTLRNVALNYGGDEAVNGGATLICNKKTLVALGDVRGTSEKKAVYEITPDGANPSVGVIKDGGLAVSYILNENVADNTIIYGQLERFELDLFSNYEVRVSEDYLFNKGMLAIRGSVNVGGEVAYKDGFIVASVGA